MSYPTFQYSNYSIDYLGFTPNAIAFGESSKIGIALSNRTGYNLTSVYIYVSGRYPINDSGTQFGYLPEYYLHGSSSHKPARISWANDQTLYFEIDVSFSPGYGQPSPNLTGYSFPRSLTQMSIYIGTGEYEDYCLSLCGGINSGDEVFLSILNKRDNISASFETNRINDESTTVEFSITAASNTTDISTLKARGYVYKLYASNQHSPAQETDTQLTLSGSYSIGDIFDGTVLNKTDIITNNNFDTDDNWSFLLVISNGYETKYVYSDVPASFANVHLAGLSTGGVAFGKFSSSTQGHPLFENEYPSRLKGINVFDEDNTEIETGGLYYDKPVYMRHYHFDTANAGGVGNDKILTSYQIPDLDLFVSIKGMAYKYMYVNGSKVITGCYPIPYYGSNSNYMTCYGGITMLNGQVVAAPVYSVTENVEFFIVVEYTKTT